MMNGAEKQPVFSTPEDISRTPFDRGGATPDIYSEKTLIQVMQAKEIALRGLNTTLLALFQNKDGVELIECVAATLEVFQHEKSFLTLSDVMNNPPTYQLLKHIHAKAKEDAARIVDPETRRNAQRRVFATSRELMGTQPVAA